MRIIFAVLLLTLAAACTAPANSNQTAVPNQPPAVSVTVTPSPASVETGSTLQFTATVNGTANQSVNWSVLEGAAGGTITVSGLYTPPGVAGTYHVVATPVADNTKSTTVAVSVTTSITIAVSPATADVAACSGTAVQFGTTFTGTADTRTVWSVQEPNGGTITASGLYTKPADGSVGTFHVIATSLADTTKIATAVVTVALKVIKVTVSPPSVTLPPGGTTQFTAIQDTSCGALVSSTTAKSFQMFNTTYLMTTEKNDNKEVVTLFKRVAGGWIPVASTSSVAAKTARAVSLAN